MLRNLRFPAPPPPPFWTTRGGFFLDPLCRAPLSPPCLVLCHDASQKHGGGLESGLLNCWVGSLCSGLRICIFRGCFILSGNKRSTRDLAAVLQVPHLGVCVSRLVSTRWMARAAAAAACVVVRQVIPVSEHILGTMAGGAADCTFWLRYLGMQVWMCCGWRVPPRVATWTGGTT